MQILDTILPAVGALAAVVALVLMAGRAARITGLARAGIARRGTGQTQRLLLRDTLALDRVRRLHVIQCDGREVLLLTGGTTDVVVGWISPNGDEV